MPADLGSPEASAAQALLEEILALPVESTAGDPWPRPQRAGRVVTVVGSAALAAGAAAAAVGVVALRDPGGPARREVITSVPGTASIDVTRVAATSSTALERSGRARVVFELQAGTPAAQRGVNDVTWSGDDIEMRVRIEAGAGRPASDAWTKTVDGTSYSLVGPKDGARHWERRSGAGPAGGQAMFDADPRTLLSILDPAAGFTDAGTDRIDGVATRHLHATAVDDLPPLDLGLWPDLADTSVTRLDLWVGPDDVVRRMHLDLHHADAKDGGGPGVDQDSTYSVTFSDLGVPITITAPTSATAATAAAK